MKIQILSDQHVDFKQNFSYFSNRCMSRSDIMIVAGDLCPHNSSIHESYIRDNFLSKWKNTIIIPGNHEFYGSHVNDDWFGSKRQIFQNGDNTVYYVNNEVIEIDEVYFICSTLWSHIGYEKASQIQYMMNDYRQIQGLTVDQVNVYHEINREFLIESIESIPTGKKCVLVTHHVPSFNLISDRWRGNELNDAFSADMDTFIMKYDHKISLWIHGHSHDRIDKRLGETRFIRNPMGYPGERDCDMDLVVSI